MRHKGQEENIYDGEPEHQSHIPGATRHTFYGRLMSDQIKAEESAAMVALQFICSCYGFWN